ncbi:hypothetical protein GVAV_001962 [Gurleya vavrai]
MDKMIERVKIWETNDEESHKKNRNFNKNFDNYEIRTRKNEFRVQGNNDKSEPKKEVICYKCGKAGHIQRFCPKINEVNFVDIQLSNENKKIDFRQIKLNSKAIRALFDTGATYSFIGMKAVNYLGVQPRIMTEPESFTTIKNST